MKMKNSFNFWEKLKGICSKKIVVKVIEIPITLTVAYLMALVVEQASVGNVFAVQRYSLILLLLIIISICLQTIATILINKQKSKAINRCNNLFLEIFLSNPEFKLFQTNYGEVIENLTNDLEAMTNRYINIYPCIVSSLVGILGYLVFLFYQKPIIATSLFVIGCIQFLPPFIVKKYMQMNYDQCRLIEEKITNHVAEAVNGFEMIKLYGLKKWWFDKMEKYHEDYIRIGRKTDAIATAQQSMYKLLDNILKFGTYALLGVYVMFQFCPIDVAIQAIYLSGSLYTMMKTLFSTIPEIAVSHSAEKRLIKWSNVNNSEYEFVSDSKNNDIVIKNLSYSYENEKVIDNINYQLNFNKNYLLKGNNGSGKTTFINILARLIVPDSGEISIRNEFFIIPQYDPEYSFCADTLFNMFDKEKQEKISKITKLFGLSEEILKEVAIRDLSGGERKKVFLAIGFAMESMWLILDEPTNNLDNFGKKVLSELIGERKGIILVSHECLFNNVVDCVIKIENGRIYNEKG